MSLINKDPCIGFKKEQIVDDLPYGVGVDRHRGWSCTKLGADGKADLADNYTSEKRLGFRRPRRWRHSKVAESAENEGIRKNIDYLTLMPPKC